MRWEYVAGILGAVALSQTALAEHLVNQQVIQNSPYSTFAVSLISASLMKGKILEWGTGVVAGLSGVGVLGLFSKSFANAYSELRFLGTAAVGGLVTKAVGSAGRALRGLSQERTGPKGPKPDSSGPSSGISPTEPISRTHEKVPSTGPEATSTHRPTNTAGTTGAVHRDKTSTIATAMQELKGAKTEESGPTATATHGRRKVLKNVGGYNIEVEKPLREEQSKSRQKKTTTTTAIGTIHGGADDRDRNKKA